MATGRSVTSTFFGTSTIYITDGVSGIFTDAFFTRPALLHVGLGRISPNRSVIARTLDRAAVGPVDAIYTAHSHHDHAMDSAEIIKLRGGTLYGSESTLNIGRGANLSEERLCRIVDGDEFTFGNFTVRVFEGLHSPGNRYPGTIDEPLRMPARVSAFKDGGCFSYLVSHPTGKIFIHPSANFVPNKFVGTSADVLYLGIGALGAQDQQFRDDYWHHTVDTLNPRLVIPVHWDNFGHPLTKRLRPLPRFMDKFAETQQFLDSKQVEGAASIRWQRALETITPLTP